MRIYPRYQLRPRYLGEARIYDLLSALTPESGFAVHSVNLPEHEYKRWGEADFVVVSKAGLTVLEVKGGNVSLVGREWFYKNARGRAIVSTEGPAAQALSAAIAIEALLRTRLGRRVRCRWGVVFPLCSFRRDLAELPPTRLADIRTCQDAASFASWLDRVPFDQHDANDFALDEGEIEAIRDVLVPEFSAAISLGLSARAAQQEAFRLTGQQFAILESLEANARICVSGGAGTGKSELAALCAMAEQAAGRQPAIFTSDTPFAAALRARMAPCGIPVVSGALPSGTDVLIVDEGQDQAQPARMEHVFRQLPGGLAAGRWRWFMDPNLQFMDAPPDPVSLDLLTQHSVPVALRRNVRSTREIVSLIRTFLDADVGTSHVDGFGIKVAFRSVADVDEEVAAVRARVSDALADGVQPFEIAILGAGGNDGPACARLARLIDHACLPLSPEGHVRSCSHGVITGIRDFRGMEARVVMLVDLDCLPAGRLGESLLYMGMSRAGASLLLPVRPSFREFLGNLAKASFEHKRGDDEQQ
ncbi:nuclease-related domain-containing protein [Variovorax robiniae]|uniref:Nuclease-related domain-containing protein n=1 Tax=Variovorax robiniae TaxID=1836199 RepID=A0ABU8XI17_9BURK